MAERKAAGQPRERLPRQIAIVQGKYTPSDPGVKAPVAFSGQVESGAPGADPGPPEPQAPDSGAHPRSAPHKRADPAAEPAPTTPQPPAGGLVLALGADALGRALGLSRRSIMRLNSAGKVPRPVKLSRRCLRWPVTEIEGWLAAGCPNRRTWEQLRG
jgi:predicted DNA-binding transcriptional regulator AlpA